MTSPPTSLTIDIRPAPARVWTPTGVNIYKKHFDKSNEKLKEHISNASIETYGQIAKVLQVDTVTSLANGRNTFLLAGTGFGKSRIAEMYYQLIPGRYKAVVLVLNPLDTLGDNQVLEKVQAGFTAINLTKLTFNEQTAKEILIGDYHGPAEKQTSSHLRHQDSGLFQPSYGKLGAQLLFRNNKPLLLLSATCRPMATEAIMKSLKLTDESLDILRGELTRPEIRIIRVTMSNSLSSSLDVIKLFPSKLDVSDNNMVPTLVYSGSCNRTMAVLEAIDRARETPDQSKFANSTCARRFHSCTGDKDKEKCIEEFADGKFPLISCTMALGLGKNWKR
ncbi:hypothetical protein PCANC_26309, partial [Puccinia coronata f. sp. avenae]